MQTHIEEISLENFKVFKNKFDFQFAPITILTGTNSSGKSSLIKAFHIMNNLFSDGSVKDIIDIEEIASIMGDFSKIPNKKSLNVPVCFYMPIILRGIPDKMQLKLSYKLMPSTLNRGKLIGLEILSTKKKLETETDNVIFSILEESNDLKFKIIIDYVFFKQAYLEEAKKIAKYKKETSTVNSEEIHPFYHKFLTEGIIKGSLYNYRPFFDRYPGFFNIEHYTILSYTYDYAKENNEARIFEDKNLISVSQENYSDEFEKIPEAELAVLSKEAEYEYFKKAEYSVEPINKKLNTPNYISQIINEFDYCLPRLYPHDNFDENNEYIGGFNSTRVSGVKTQNFVWHNNSLNFDYPLGLALENYNKYGDVYFKANMQFPVFFIFENIKYSISEALENFDNCHFLSIYRNQVQRAYTLKDGGEFQRLIKKIKETEDNDPNNKILKFINKYLTRFEIGHGYKIVKETESQGLCVYIKVKGEDVLLADMGYGISQVLPLIFKIISVALEDGDNKKLLIEEPESNLHPALQSKLAELFADAAEHFNIQFIIETHSEYFIRKLQVLTANTYAKKRDGKYPKLAVDNTVIYYFNHPDKVNEEQEQVYKINIEKDGALKRNFGRGFFDEASKLNIALYQFSKANKN